MIGTLATAGLVIAMTGAALAVPSQRDSGPLGFPSPSGQDLFDFYCATCHGRDARGKGPVALALKTEPADLTTLALRNGGTFPRVEVISYIEGTGRPLPSHGPGDMPVWGPLFRALEISDPRLRIRIESVAAYIESLQVP
jgi:mono/diheme cytochrome c family protein